MAPQTIKFAQNFTILKFSFRSDSGKDHLFDAYQTFTDLIDEYQWTFVFKITNKTCDES